MGFLVKNLFKVNGRWKYRKVIPTALRPYIDRNLTEFVRWLGSDDLGSPALMSKYAKAAAECESLIEIAKKRSTGKFDTLTPEVIAHLIASERSNLLYEDEEERFEEEADEVFDNVRARLQSTSSFINDDEDRRYNNRQETLEALLSLYKHAYARGNIPPVIHDDLTGLCAAQGLHVDAKSLDFRRLGKAYLAMLIETTTAKLDRQKGEIVPTPTPPAIQTITEVVAQGLTVREMAEKKLAMRKKGYSTQEATETALRLFESAYGQIPMSSITRRDVSDWILLLQDKPSRPAKEHRDLGLRELVALYRDRKDIDRLSGKSINGHVGHLSAIWTWARKSGHVDRSLDNPFSEQRVDETPPPPSEGFTPSQLQAIFKLPVFTAGERPQRGRGDAAFWIPLLLLTYGTRPEEICQLLTSDVFVDDENKLWCLRITDEGDHPAKGSRKIKDGGVLVRRTLPVTQQLIDFGFLEYVEKLKQAKELALFPKLTIKGKRGYLYEGFAEWWGIYLRSHGAIPETGNKPLRDFRATWTTAAARSGLTEEEREWIQGHYVSKGKTSNRVYGVRDFGSKVNDVVFKGLDLSHLKKVAPLRFDHNAINAAF